MKAKEPLFIAAFFLLVGPDYGQDEAARVLAFEVAAYESLHNAVEMLKRLRKN